MSAANQKHIYSYLLFLCLVVLLPLVSAQPNCSNYYSELNLPEECNYQNSTCSFSSLTNASLIINNTGPDQFGLCLNLPSFSVEMVGIDLFELSVYIYGKSISCNSGYFFISNADLVLIAEESITLNNASLSAKLVWLESDTIEIWNATIMK